MGRGVDGFLNPGEAGSSVRGIICPLVWIGLTDLPKSEGLWPPWPPSSYTSGVLVKSYCFESHCGWTKYIVNVYRDLQGVRRVFQISQGYSVCILGNPVFTAGNPVISLLIPCSTLYGITVYETFFFLFFLYQNIRLMKLRTFVNKTFDASKGYSV